MIIIWRLERKVLNSKTSSSREDNLLGQESAVKDPGWLAVNQYPHILSLLGALLLHGPHPTASPGSGQEGREGSP